jgi:hypothetical protein
MARTPSLIPDNIAFLIADVKQYKLPSDFRQYRPEDPISDVRVGIRICGGDSPFKLLAID